MVYTVSMKIERETNILTTKKESKLITKENFRIEYRSTYLTFVPSTAKTHADFTHVCSRDRRFHKWTCAKVRDLLIKELNDNNITEDKVTRDVVESFLDNGAVKEYITANVPSWMRS